MDVALWTGNGSTQTISGLGFSPDFVWVKVRSNAGAHGLFDTVRGAGYKLVSNTTNAEAYNGIGSGGDLIAFNSDGFNLGDNTAGSAASTNLLNYTYVGWAWDAGTSTVSNTQGSITSQVRANASAGFSVVTYTGTGASATVGHGLGVAPSLIIVKARDNSTFGGEGWNTYHSSLPAGYALQLNSTQAQVTGMFTSTLPTSSVFTLSTNSGVNESPVRYVAYCFSSVVGYSNGFSYTGNGSTDGVFQYLGFRPRLILLKCSSTTGNWTLLDTAREGYNVDNDPLYPNLSNAEGTTDLLDITSNGFKLRSTDASVNASAGTYIGFAWAENPFQYARAR